MTRWLPLALALLTVTVGRADNLCRNGSFEGSTLYWHNLDGIDRKLVHGEATVGEYALRINKGWAMCAPLVCRPGEPFTISFDVKGDRPGEVRVQLPPSAREVGQQAKRLWAREGAQAAPIGTAWRRVSFTARADVRQTGFWPQPHYMALIEGTVPLLVDGVVVTLGDRPAERFEPRRPVEILSDCPDLPGYPEAGNLLQRDAPVRLTAHVSNPGDQSRDLTLRFEFIDYDGSQRLGEALERPLTLPAGATLSETITRPLPAGCVLSRVSAIAEGQTLDQSDLPLTALPYPFAPRRPDVRERFGGSFFGPASAARGSQLGFAWSRWFPHTKWQDHQPDGPETFRWFDRELDTLEALGISSHLVLYGWPKWIMDADHPLPRDMRWPADDPRWDDLTVETAWDRYLKAVAEHYRGRPVVFELENEPELDKWDKFRVEYAKFTIRSARLIKEVDPTARVMVNNVYAIPSGLNRLLLERGGAKWIDIISWHDYHEGWLTDAPAIRRMRAALDELGGRHIEIWFNEGWAFTNTAVDEPLACGRLTAAQSTHAMVCSVAEMTVAGQDKTVLFHTGYERHGMSFWDYSGPGTMLWDWYGYPLPLVAAWNTLCWHLGLSERVGLVRPPGANLAIFEDLRNGRGVMVAYADREAPADVTLELPLTGLVAEDAMGRSAPLTGPTLTLPKSGRPVFLYATDKRSGRVFHDTLEPFDRRHVGFVSAGGTSIGLPAAWEGQVKGQALGNPALADGRPLWRLDQVWPPDPSQPAHFRPLVWRDGWWVPVADSFGDQPKAELRDRGLRLEFRARHGNPPAERLAGLTFLVPRSGRWRLTGSARLRLWDGQTNVRLSFLHKTADRVREIASVTLTPGQTLSLEGLSAEAAAGDELCLLPRPGGQFTGGDVTLLDLVFTLGGGTTWTLPATWEGRVPRSPEGNPLLADGRPIWRLDQLWPTDPTLPANYRPLVWFGDKWDAPADGLGGQPAITVRDGAIRFSVRGPWGGPPANAHPRTAALVFCAPRAGVYRVTGQARNKPWDGQAPVARLGIFKKDTQRATLLTTLELPRDDSRTPFELTVELTDGHELLLLPLMPDWHNATTITIEGLTLHLPEP